MASVPAQRMSNLHIADKLKLPVEAVTQTFGILGKRGGGKSYTAKVMAEEMIKAGAHVCAVDPIGNWWGLRVAADGKTPGLPITVLGGDYGDLPLQANEKAGEEIARLIIEEKISVVIDLSRFRKGEQTEFMIGWAETTYRLNREPLHLFIDEADAWAPQRTVGNRAPRLLGAMEDLVRRGRARGLGVTMITQRSASINKDLLTQIEVLIAKRTIAPQDREAIEAWVKVHGTPEQKQTLLGSLASLPVESAWFWSPAWLDLFQLVSVRKLETFDSSATPEVGKRLIQPRKLAAVDLEKLNQRLAQTIERAKQDDPRELRRQIAELKKQLVSKGSGTKTEAAADGKEFERGYEKGKREAERAAAAGQAGKDKSIRELLMRTRKKLLAALAALGNEPINEIDEALIALKAPSAHPIIDEPPHATFQRVNAPPTRPTSPRPAVEDSSKNLGSGERQILAAIAQYPAGATRQQLTVLTGYKRSTRDRYIQYLAAAGRIVVSGDRIRATEQGMEALGTDFQPLPNGEELRRHWLETLPEGESKILHMVMLAYPQAVDRDAITERIGYQRSTRDRYIQYLQARQLVEAVGRGEVRASAELFED